MYYNFFVFFFAGMEEALNLAANELFNQNDGARLNVTKFVIVFSDGDFTPFSPVTILFKVLPAGECGPVLVTKLRL